MHKLLQNVETPVILNMLCGAIGFSIGLFTAIFIVRFLSC